MFFDGLTNAITGAGTSVDKASHRHYAVEQVNAQQIVAAYRSSWLLRKIIDIPAADMTRAWRDWQADADTIGTIEAGERAFGLRAKMQEALRLGRLGGGAILIGIVGDDATQPLAVRPSTQVAYLHVMSRWQLLCGERVTDPADPMFGEPRWFEITGEGGTGTRVHSSRVVTFKGVMIPAGGTITGDDAYWGDSIFHSIGGAIRNADAAQGGFASLIDEASYDIIGIPGLMAMFGEPGSETRVQRRLEAVRLGKSMHRSIIKDAAETWETRQVSWTGMPDILASYLAIVAGAADIPATRLLGKAPDGMNATGEGDERNYLTSITSRQEAEMRPALERLDAVLFASFGELPWYEFAPLRHMNEGELATIAKTRAETTKIYADSGLVPLDALAHAVQGQLVEDGTYPGLGDALVTANAAVAGGPDDIALLEGNMPGAPLRLVANDADALAVVAAQVAQILGKRARRRL